MDSVCEVRVQQVVGLGNIYNVDIDLDEKDKRTIIFIGEYNKENSKSRLGLGKFQLHNFLYF